MRKSAEGRCRRVRSVDIDIGAIHRRADIGDADRYGAGEPLAAEGNDTDGKHVGAVRDESCVEGIGVADIRAIRPRIGSACIGAIAMEARVTEWNTVDRNRYVSDIRGRID